MCLAAELSKDGRPLQLRDIAAALRKTDDPQGIAPALRAAEALVAANPDELSHYAGPHSLPEGTFVQKPSCYLQA